MKPTAALALILILSIPCCPARRGVGVSGPDQILSMHPGETTTSYVRIYNTGDEPTTYLISISGNASGIVAPESGEITIQPDQNARVVLNYTIPSVRISGTYSGSLLVSIEGQQISPGVSKDITVTVTDPEANLRPSVEIVAPGTSRVSGVVDIAVEASDPEGEEVEVGIYLDGALVSDLAEYRWDTELEENGEHLITARASDGTHVVTVNLTVWVDNSPVHDAIWLTVMLSAFAGAVLVSAGYSRMMNRSGGENGS